MRFLNIPARKEVAISGSGYFLHFSGRELENPLTPLYFITVYMKMNISKEKIMMKHKNSFTLIELLVDTACFPCKASKV